MTSVVPVFQIIGISHYVPRKITALNYLFILSEDRAIRFVTYKPGGYNVKEPNISVLLSQNSVKPRVEVSLISYKDHI